MTLCVCHQLGKQSVSLCQKVFFSAPNHFTPLSNLSKIPAMDPSPPSYDEAISEKPLKPTAPPAETTATVVETGAAAPTNVAATFDDDLCPVCRTGHLQKSYSCLGVCLAIVLFPCGILCCLKLTDRVCDNENCGATY